jgi:PD-(D/E)XK nuclease superfamily
MNFPIGTYTFYNDAMNCPYKAYRRYVKRDLPYAQTEAMERGIAVHEAMEDRIGKDKPLPEEMRTFEHIAKKLSAMPSDVKIRVEYRLAIKADASPCAWDAGLAWFRGKLDVAVIGSGAWIIDWKTGKVREDPFELECQSLLLHANHPQCNPIVGEYYWMREGAPGMRYTLDPMVAYTRISRLYGEMHGYFEKDAWPKRKNPLCGWCDVLDCEHNRSERK